MKIPKETIIWWGRICGVIFEIVALISYIIWCSVPAPSECTDNTECFAPSTCTYQFVCSCNATDLGFIPPYRPYRCDPSGLSSYTSPWEIVTMTFFLSGLICLFFFVCDVHAYVLFDKRLQACEVKCGIPIHDKYQ